MSGGGEGEERRPSPIDRALRVVGDVRAGEGGIALVLASTVFVLLGAYYLLKVAREGLVLSEYSAETKAYLAAAQAVILIPAVEGYGWLSTRIGRTRLVTLATLFFASNLPVFAALHAADLPIGGPFFVWVGIFNVFVIAQFWAFANDVYTEEQGRRLFAVIGVGSSLGAIAGSYGADPLGEAIGTYGSLLVPAGLLVLTLAGVRWVSARTGKGHEPAKPADEKKGGRSAVALLFSDRYLVLIAAMWLVLNTVNTLAEYVLDVVMQDRFAAEGLDGEALSDRIRGFKSDYFFWFNTIGFLLQLFVAGRLMKRGGASLAISILPVVAVLGQGAAAISGVALSAVMVANVAYNSVNYSIQNTGRNALFLVTPAEVKYKVKVLIDSVLQRIGDVLAAAIVGVGAGVLALSPLAFVILNAGISVVWLLVTIALAREHNRRAKEAEAEPPG